MDFRGAATTGSITITDTIDVTGAGHVMGINLTNGLNGGNVKIESITATSTKHLGTGMAASGDDTYSWAVGALIGGLTGNATIDINNITATSEGTSTISGTTAFLLANTMAQGTGIKLGTVDAQAAQWAIGVHFDIADTAGAATIDTIVVTGGTSGTGLLVGERQTNEIGNITGSVSVENINVTAGGTATGVDVFGNVAGRLSSTETIKATATALGAEAYGVHVNQVNGGTIDLNIVQAISEKDFAAGVRLNNMSDGTVSINQIEAIGGDVQGGGATGLYVRDSAMAGGTLDIGSIEATASRYATGVELGSRAPSGQGMTDGNLIVGDVTAIATNEGSESDNLTAAHGIYVHGDAGGTITAGNIMATATESALGSAYGIRVTGNANNLVLEGNKITAEGTDLAYGVYVGGDANITIAQNISISGSTAGIYAGNNLTLNLAGNTLTTNSIIARNGNLTVNGNGGALFVNNGIIDTQNVFVRDGATFGGSGTIDGNVRVQTGGTLSPGNRIGTLNVHGNMTFENGSTYVFEVDKSGGTTSSDLLVVSGNGTDGSAFVNIQEGAELVVEFLYGREAAVNDRFQVIQLENGARFQNGGEFNIVGMWGFGFDTVRDNGGYWIEWYEKLPLFAENVRNYATGNAYNVAVAGDTLAFLAQQGGPEFEAALKQNNVYSALIHMRDNDPQGLANALAQLHGEAFAAHKDVVAQTQRRFQQLLPNGRDFILPGSESKVWNHWGTFTGDGSVRKGIGRYSGYDLSSFGLAVGFDRAITGNVLLGATFGYDNTNQDFKSIRSRSQIDSFRTMVYGSWYNGTWFVDAYGGYTKNLYDTKRHIDIGSFNATARSRYNDDLASVGLDVGRVCTLGNLFVTPSGGLHYIHLGSPSFTERDGGDANLHISNNTHQSLRLPIGVKANMAFTGKSGISWIPEIRAFYVREFMDDSARAHTSFNAMQGVTFAADSGVWGRDSGRFGAGVGMMFSERVQLRFDYDCEIYTHTQTDTLSATLGVSW
jgi:uncharacterized protein with beta-barrel porin domain